MTKLNMVLAIAPILLIGVIALSPNKKFASNRLIIKNIGDIINADNYKKCKAFSSYDFEVVTSRHCISYTENNYFSTPDRKLFVEIPKLGSTAYSVQDDVFFIKRSSVKNNLVKTCDKNTSNGAFYYSYYHDFEKTPLNIKASIGKVVFFKKTELKKGDSGTPVFFNESDPCIGGVFAGWIDNNGEFFDYFIDIRK